MSTTQICTNIIAYTLQIGLLVGIGAALPALFRLKAPGARLRYWQVLLVACLALPGLRPWQTEVVAVTNAPAGVEIITRITAAAPARDAMPPITEIALWILAAGVIVRLGWLAAGLLKLARYRRQGQAIPLPPEWNGAASTAQLLISDQIGGPVTFGFFRPVVLLPAGFPAMSQTMRDAILFHELIHVERNDWLFTVGEELLRALYWFHPAVWWVLGEIQLAREQTVDRAVIEMTQARDPYVDTLLAMAGVTPELDLAPAPLFLRRRHLKQRVMGIVQEVGVAKTKMSKTRMIVAEIAALTMMAGACWFVTGAIPMHAQTVMAADSAGVTVNLNGSQLMHRSPIVYPADAIAKGVEGTVVVQVRLDANGEVVDDSILSGPDELRKVVQQSVLSWHFDKSAGSSTRVVNIDFVKPPSGVTVTGALAAPAIRAQITGQAPVPGGRGGAIGTVVPLGGQTQQSSAALYQFMTDEMAQLQKQVAEKPDAANQALLDQLTKKIEEFKAANAGRIPERSMQDGTIERIDIDGLSDSAKAQLLAQLPVHAGDPHSQENMMQLRTVARQFDEHLSVSTTTNNGSGGWVVRISTPGAPSFGTGMNVSSTPPAGAITVAGNAQAMNIVSQTRPVYPPLAKMARQQGTVKFEATIGTDGTVQNLKLISGPPLLVPAALEAVKTWVYNPTLLNGVAVPVVTTIDVNFSLAPDAGTPPGQ